MIEEAPEEIKKFRLSHVYEPLLIRCCLLYTSDAADEEDSVDFGGWRIHEKKKKRNEIERRGNVKKEKTHKRPTATNDNKK